IAGAIWYQGESNTGTASTYHRLFSSMINGWREKWKLDFPFYYVQLAPFAYGNKNIAALLREAQHQTLSVPKTGMVVTTDLGDDTTDIHPRNKKDVGLRLADLALNEVYGKNLSGVKSPVYSNMRIEKNRAVISFEHTSGLVQKGKQVTGFMIAGIDGVFHPANAKIIGKTILVWNEKIKEPVAVRYAFSNTAIGNVFDQEGLPLAPFRTDNWPVDTSTIK
ncbi:MAG TPA: sialate O-acetylesterase, partial [Flavisolibacter sp.]